MRTIFSKLVFKIILMKKFIFIALAMLLLRSAQSKVWCETSRTCKETLSKYYSCNLEQNICEHESLVKISKRYIIGALLIIFISAFANAGGIGGGSVIVPLLTIMFAFQVNEAIPLSKATIFAGAVINVFFLLNSRKVDNPNKSLIDYKLCAFMLPIMMCGTFFGVYLNFIIPPMIIIALLTGYLILSIFGLRKKYFILADKEDSKLGMTFQEQIIETYKTHKDFVSKKLSDIFRKENEVKDDEEIPENSLNQGHLAYPLEVKTDGPLDKPEIIGAGNDQPSKTQQQHAEKEAVKITTAPSKPKRKIKTFMEMICDNTIFILILMSSICMIVILSLFKEGILIDLGVKISRCSKAGLLIMGVILIFCLTVSVIAFSFNIKKEKRDLNESIITGENIPKKVQDDLDLLRIQQENFEKEMSENAKHNNDDSGETDYASFQSEDIKSTFTFGNQSSIRQEPDLQTELTLSIDKHMKRSEMKSKKTYLSDVRSMRSEMSIQTIISDNMQQKRKTLVKLGGMSFLAGIGSGLLGIGGGMIINPFLIILNYSPLDSMAISSMGVLFTSTISTSEFLIMRAIRFQDLAYFLVLAGIGSLTGVFLIKELIKRYRRQSILLLIILGIFVFAVIVLPLFGLLTIPVNKYFAFGSVCDK